MRWTGDQVREMRNLAEAGKSQKEAAASLGVSRTALEKAAIRYGVRFRARRAPLLLDDRAAVRARWAKILPSLKENLRRDLNI